ncbi:hypothetical protein M9458_049878, partial [Cirrhinus mrigala]
AEPLLARIKADRTVVLSPVFDKVLFDTLEVNEYIPSAHGPSGQNGTKSMTHQNQE